MFKLKNIFIIFLMIFLILYFFSAVSKPAQSSEIINIISHSDSIISLEEFSKNTNNNLFVKIIKFISSIIYKIVNLIASLIDKIMSSLTS